MESRSLISYAQVYRGTDDLLSRVAMNFCSRYGLGAPHPSLYSPKAGVIDIVLIGLHVGFLVFLELHSTMSVS